MCSRMHVRQQGARAVADGLIEIFSRTSLPMQILSDRVTQFTSTLLEELCELLGVDQIKTTAYNPCCGADARDSWSHVDQGSFPGS